MFSILKYLWERWPEIICTDRGTNFCSQLTREFLRILVKLSRTGVTPRLNTEYHSEAAGVIERFNGSFKSNRHLWECRSHEECSRKRHSHAFPPH